MTDQGDGGITSIDAGYTCRERDCMQSWCQLHTQLCWCRCTTGRCWSLMVPATCLAQLSTETAWLYISFDLRLHMGLTGTGIGTGKPLGCIRIGKELCTALHNVVRRWVLLVRKLVSAPVCVSVCQFFFHSLYLSDNVMVTAPLAPGWSLRICLCSCQAGSLNQCCGQCAPHVMSKSMSAHIPWAWVAGCCCTQT